ncbi:alpha,alpha-trehalose-phosphate synthase (UDP-forming) [Entomobacter blattae]|uniref:Trehalose-6-phosphate synthase n=1 Tax=Entomobacter blattae TaxID=2762277 RepID=A0A7H1NQ74_9PROT|nr:trehalose-6-phosphate synthase [Entomobacter blattae]QNT77934.1 Trehalose-6-phosphate synthase [Entomobacter blattae]
MTKRLVLVSNRVPSPGEMAHPAGGLAVGLRDAIGDRRCLWFGWSGNQVKEGDDIALHTDTVEKVTFATIDLTEKQYEGFYTGFSNGILWPLFHYRTGLMQYARSDWKSYLEVNALFAQRLKPLLQKNDVLWVHDYHLIPLGRSLRDGGIKDKIGFFLHIPFPPWGIFSTLPGADLLLMDMQAYDVIGVQTEEDAYNLNAAFELLGLKPRAKPFPIGIDPEEFAEQAAESLKDIHIQQEKLNLRGRALIMGVDRLDYSKGLPERLRGYAAFLERYPEYLGKVVFLQIAPLSRTEVQQYQALRKRVDELVGQINGIYTESGWTPIEYVTRSIARPILAGLHRMSDVALITPLRDGMNLVAKEYIAAQDEDDPGCLILSRFAGAAPELEEAIIVNPYDADEIADALALALSMKKEERKKRWQKLRRAIDITTAHTWAKSFMAELDERR